MRAAESPAPLPHDVSQEAASRLDAWMEVTAARLDLEVEPVAARYVDCLNLVRRAAPAVLRLRISGEMRFLVLLESAASKALVVRPNLGTAQVSAETIRRALCAEIEEPAARKVRRLLDEASVPARSQGQALMPILRERLGRHQIQAGWLLRMPPGSNLWRQMREARVPARAAALVAAHAAEYALWALSWWMVGSWALQGKLDGGRLLAWALVLMTVVPLRLIGTWLEGWLAMRAGGVLKQRLLHGALRLEPEEVRCQGVGQLLGRVMESEAMESLALSGGILGGLALIELAVASVVLAVGAGGAVHALLLAAWVALAALMAWRYFVRRRQWTEQRLAMTHDLVERMVGHRTQLAQQTPELWHDGEDEALQRYLEASAQMDRAMAWLTALVPRGWLVLGLLPFAPSFISGRSSPAALAVRRGGVLLAFRVLRRLVIGIGHLAGARIAWQQVTQLVDAAARCDPPGSPQLAVARHREPPSAGHHRERRWVVEAQDLTFTYPDRVEWALNGCSLSVSIGERVLLKGRSGSGKSTLASILAGVRAPRSGLLLMNGLDRQTVGLQTWRRRLVAAPQFHENHVLTETFAFNLLMGRRWPPTSQDLDEAEGICRELGLGDLLARMPAGLQQMVGDTGWQLSHGERSRLYIARAVLQNADLVILDESLAALDPENLQRSLLRQKSALLR